MGHHFRDKPWTEDELPLSVRKNMEQILKGSVLSETLDSIAQLSKQLTNPISELTRAIEQMQENLHFKEIEDFAAQFASLHSGLLENWDQVIRAYGFLNPAISDDELAGLPSDSEAAKKEALRTTIMAIGVEDTKLKEKYLPKRRLRLGTNHRLYDQANKNVGIDLSDQMYALVLNLRKKSTQTKKLTQAAKYKNDETTRGAILRLNELSYNGLILHGSLAVGEKDDGYRLAKFVTIKI